jgi:hypothetical protein
VNIVAMKRSAVSPELLSTLLNTLAKSVEQDGPAPIRTITVIVRDGTRRQRLYPGEQINPHDTISRLLAAAPTSVPGVGVVPAITLELRL